MTDFNDAMNEKGAEAVNESIQNPYKPEDIKPAGEQAQVDMQATIKRLAALSPLEYDRIRKDEAKILGCRAETLDAEVYKGRPAKADEKGMDSMFPAVEPWPDPINGAVLLDEIYETIRRFIICDKETARAIALWIVFTWFIDVVQISPIAIITAPEKRCGKSLLLILISLLVRRALVASNISPAAIFRVVEGYCPTLLIDEADTFLRDNEEARGILNSGHTRQAAYVIRNVGDNHEPKKFSTWSAKVISGIGALADTLMDRGVIFELRRKLPDEKVERLRHADKSVFKRLESMLARYALDASAEIERARPVLPDKLNDRAQDNWEPLLAVADHAGGAWPKVAREAALILSGVEQEATSLSTELLADIRDIFAGKYKSYDRISTADLLQELNADDMKPWATYGKGDKPMTARQLAKMLEDYGIKSDVIRIGRGTPRGFHTAWFDDAFVRYLPSPDALPEKSATAQQSPINDSMAGLSSVADHPQRCSIENTSATPNLLKENKCFDVADKTGESGVARDEINRLADLPEIGV